MVKPVETPTELSNKGNCFHGNYAGNVLHMYTSGLRFVYWSFVEGKGCIVESSDGLVLIGRAYVCVH